LSLLDSAIVRALPAVPRPVVQRLSARYIAGPDLADAVGVIREQNRRGKLATVDVLGEAIANEEEAQAFVRAYCEALAAIEREGLQAGASVKPTALGLALGYELCRENVTAVVEEAAARDNFVRIEMEDSTTTDDTLRLYRELREAGHANIGIVLQAYLRRTLDDARGLADLRPNVRLVKGIYVEPAAIAFEDDQEIRASYLETLGELLAGGSFVGIATHDDRLIDGSLRLVEEHGIEIDGYEFQMLLGVRESRGDRLVADGHQLRIYVPFGERWYEYSLRRLQENPRIAGYIATDVVSRVLRARR
jgi:proline dehydrogenase